MRLFLLAPRPKSRRHHINKGWAWFEARHPMHRTAVLVRPSFTDPRMCLPRQGSMSVPVPFGATDSVGRCSTSAFFTPMPPLYGWFKWRASMSSTRRQRGANMSSACETSKELRLYLLYSARQEEWVVPQPSHSSDRQRCLPRKLA